MDDAATSVSVLLVLTFTGTVGKTTIEIPYFLFYSRSGMKHCPRINVVCVVTTDRGE